MFRRINQRILSIKLVLVLKKDFVSRLWHGFLRVFSSLASPACNPGPSFNMRSVFKFSNMLVYCSSQSPLFARAVLLVADLFHPVDNLAVEPFLNRDVRHGSGRRGPPCQCFSLAVFMTSTIRRITCLFVSAFLFSIPRTVRKDSPTCS